MKIFGRAFCRSERAPILNWEEEKDGCAKGCDDILFSDYDDLAFVDVREWSDGERDREDRKRVRVAVAGRSRAEDSIPSRKSDSNVDERL